jgi:hypothetical protein
MTFIWFTVGVMVLLAAVSGTVMFRLAAEPQLREVSPLWLAEFSLARYRPMRRLLSENDLRFLESRPGYRPEVGRTLRAERRKAFRGYLNEIKKDFWTIHALAKQILLDWPEDNPELGVLLMKSQGRFLWSLARIEFYLALHWTGISTPKLDPLFGALESLYSGVRLANQSVA